MKTNKIINLIFGDWEPFVDETYGVIEDNLDFHCDMVHKFTNLNNIKFYSDYVEISLEISDAEGNGGYLTCSIRQNILQSAHLYFQYSDGNEYDKMVYDASNVKY
jgi:hypothetical protein